MQNRRPRGLLLVLAASLLYSTAGLFTHALHRDTWTILAWRAVFATLFLLVWMIVEHRGAALRAFALRPREIALAVPTAISGICYIFALKLTTVADVMVIYATLPFVVAAVAWAWTREVPAGRTMVASCAALGGVAIMMVGGFGSGSRLAGMGATLIMNLGFAMILVNARESPRTSTAIYTVGTAMSGVLAFAVAPEIVVPLRDMVLLALFGVLTIGLAMALYMAGARLIPPADVGLVAIVDVVVGPALVWQVFGEEAGPWTIAGGVVVVVALLWRLAPDLRRLGRGVDPVARASQSC